MTKKKNFMSFYKQIRVIRSINASTSSKIDEIIGGAGPIKTQFDQRTKLQQDMALKYGSYKTEAMKMVYLHKVASKAFTLDFTTAEDGVQDDE